MHLSQKNEGLHQQLLFGLTAIIIFVIFRRAWLNDDAFITLRTVDNFVNGFGLTWNIYERVQSFTHPTWMMILTLVYFFTREPFYTTIAVSLLFSTLSVYFLLRNFSDNIIKVLVAASTLLFSRAFIDFSTSGLENPLSHFLIIIFFGIFLRHYKNLTQKQITILSLISSFGMLNRLDLFLIFAPTLGYILYLKKDLQTVKGILIGQIPLISWLVFSLIYYGYLVPNTAFAKLPINIQKKDLIAQGIAYYFHSLITDPLTIIMIILPISFGIRQKKKISLILISSGLLYLFYILWIGGDFMEGRFFTVPLIISSILFLTLDINSYHLHLGLLSLVVLIGLSIPHNTLTIIEKFPDTINLLPTNGISDERLFYFDSLGLLSRRRQQIGPSHQRINVGLELRRQNVEVFPSEMVGMEGYYAGPYVHIIDKMGLCDPLLSKLPVESPENWRIGHFLRSIPDGYEDSILTDTNQVTDLSLFEYYKKIRIITRGKVFDLERFTTILHMNFGRYNYLINN